jgi:hypothetical protein
MDVCLALWSSGALENAMASDLHHARQLLNRLGPSQLAAVVHLLESMISGEDRDTLSDAERKAIAEADEWLAHNQPISHEKILAELGLSSGDWEKIQADYQSAAGCQPNAT